jgi:hypothetical protein
MTVSTNFCVDCGEKNDRKGICCISCLKQRKQEVMKKYKTNNKERIKEIKKKFNETHKKRCKYCGRKIWLDSKRCRHCAKYDRKKKKVKKDKSGYIQIYNPKHPYADHKGYVREHRLVVEKKIGRILNPKEAIHHIDCNKQNNKIENLMLFPTQKDHMKFHTKIVQFGYTNPILKQIEGRWKNPKI